MSEFIKTSRFDILLIALDTAKRAGAGVELSELGVVALVEEIATLQSRIAELEAESERFTVHSDIEWQDDKWIPVSERLPEKQKLTIGFTDNSAYVFFEIVNDDEMGLVMYPYQNRKGNVTHWMPLPESPNDTQTQTIVYGKESEE